MVVCLCLWTSCQDNEPVVIDDHVLLRQILEEKGGRRGINFFRLPASDDLSNIPQDPRNTLTQEKIELGKMLFHETAFSTLSSFPEAQKTFSCATCHHAEAGFQSGLRQGIGDGGVGFGFLGEGRMPNPACAEDLMDVHQIKTPTVINVAYQGNLMWGGEFGSSGMNLDYRHLWNDNGPLETNKLGYEGAEIQAIAGIDLHHLSIDAKSVEDNNYTTYFDEAFSDLPASERYSSVTAGLAIAAYERSLLPNKAPFQRWLNGERSAMSDTQIQGALLFFGKANCVACHTGPSLSLMDFKAVGFANLDGPDIITEAQTSPSHTLGRGGFTGEDEDLYAYKIPQLYNLKNAGYYGHGASFNSIREVIEYKNAAIPENPRSANHLATEFQPLDLTENEIIWLTEFVENALYDDEISRYVPAFVPSGACFPNNDYLSRFDLNCN